MRASLRSNRVFFFNRRSLATVTRQTASRQHVFKKMSRLSRDKVRYRSGRRQPHGHIEVFSRTLNGWARVVALSRRHEGFDARGTPFPASLVAEFNIPGLGRCRKATARGSGLLQYIKPGSMTSSRSPNDTEQLTLDDSSSEELGDSSEIESEDDPESGMRDVQCSSENPVVEGLKFMGVQNRMAEIVGSRFQTVEEVETAFQWLLTSQPIKSQETPKDTMATHSLVRAKCLYEDIVFCEAAGSDGIYTVGGHPLSPNIGIVPCMNREHRYCYDCLWRAVREELMNNVIPRCCGSSDLRTHEIVGGCGGAGHKADCNCGTCGHALLSPLQLEDIMNGYFREVQSPSDEERRVWGLKWGIFHDGTSRWRSSKLERLCFNHVIRHLGGIECPNVDCKAMIVLPSAEYLGPVHCTAKACRFHLEPFCSRCFRPAHQDWASCDEIAGISAEWLRWCFEGRVAFLTQAVNKGFGFCWDPGARYDKTSGQLKPHIKIAQANYDSLKKDEEYKTQNCRLCPSCNRVIEKIDGCNAIVCGSDYHGGGNLQKGCGHRFNFLDATRYVSAKVERNQVVDTLVELQARDVSYSMISRLVQTLHFYSDGGPWCCHVCRKHIRGPLILCINCPRFAACIECDASLDLSGARVHSHPPGHIFRVHFEPIFGTSSIEELGKLAPSLPKEDRVVEHGNINSIKKTQERAKRRTLGGFRLWKNPFAGMFSKKQEQTPKQTEERPKCVKGCTLTREEPFPSSNKCAGDYLLARGAATGLRCSGCQTGFNALSRRLRNRFRCWDCNYDICEPCVKQIQALQRSELWFEVLANLNAAAPGWETSDSDYEELKRWGKDPNRIVDWDERNYREARERGFAGYHERSNCAFDPFFP